MESLFYDVVKNGDVSKNILYILKAYVMVYIITNYRDSSISLEVKVVVGDSFALAPTLRQGPKKLTQNRVKIFK